MNIAMKRWIKAARNGEMDMPLVIAIGFAVTTAPVIGLFWLLKYLKRKK